MEKELSIIIDGKEYKVHVTKKSQRNMYFRYRDDMFGLICIRDVAAAHTTVIYLDAAERSTSKRKYLDCR